MAVRTGESRNNVASSPASGTPASFSEPVGWHRCQRQHRHLTCPSGQEGPGCTRWLSDPTSAPREEASHSRRASSRQGLPRLLKRRVRRGGGSVERPQVCSRGVRSV